MNKEELEAKAKTAFENTKNGMGFNKPQWNELAEQTKQVYRDWVVLRYNPQTPWED